MPYNNVMAFFQTDNLWINQLADGVAALVLDVPNRKVNVLTGQVFSDLETALDRVSAETSFRLLILRSGKATSFCAGADLKEFGIGKTAEEYAAFSARGQEVFNKLASLRMPTVAVIAGGCLGGGLEMAMACDYRVVVDRPETKLGLPETELSLIPGWGGTQRLPRLIGLERALQIILGGARLSARQAHRWGLADDVVQDSDEPPAFLARPSKRTLFSLPLRTWRQRLLESNGLGRWLIFRGTKRLLARRLPDDMSAHGEALQAVRVGLKQGMAAGMAHEQAAIGRLATSPACRNLVGLFFRREQARKISPLEPEHKIHRVGIIGAGTMGAGIAQLAVLQGCEVVVREAGDMALGLAMLRLMGLLQQAVAKGLLSASALTAKLSAVHGTTAWKGFDNLDLVIEAIDENLERKQKIFQELENHVSETTPLASNTSSLRIEDIQKGMSHPERVAGLHFFKPVHKMPLVEVVPASRTEKPIADILSSWAVSLGKTPIVVKDSPGFLVNRILMPYFNEAVFMISEGLSIDRIDEAMRKFGMAMGPLEVLDQVGLDVATHISRAIEPVFGERFELQPAFQIMEERRLLGKKTEIGFYRYRGKRKHANQKLAEELCLGAPQLESASPADQRAVIRERLVSLMVNESARCLEEGLIDSADMLDLAMVLGAGWAPHRGGPIRYARDLGTERTIQSLTKLAEKYGPRYEPMPGLAALLASNF
jgi:3-hydroxyacyl-CoA dehydrogenase/enoyl-CoA hydratase/3-hydroxybutyryl-CoA epimerase